jgi:hypothetical protein
MTQVIIHTNESGNVSVTTPTGETSIEEVLIKDCPKGAIIVDDSVLPQGVDSLFFNAWELNNGIVTVNLTKAKEYKLGLYNSEALRVAQVRQLNTLAGISNTMSDADFLAMLTTDRASIASATTTAQLAAINNPE